MPGNEKSGNRSGLARAPGAGRPKIKAEFRKGEQLIVERTSIVITPETPFTKPEVGTILSVSEGEIEIQIGDDILVIRRPDENE